MLTWIGAFHGRVGVDDILRMTIYSRDERSLTRLRSCCSLLCFGSSRTLVARQIFLSEALFDGFRFPIIVSNPPPSFKHSRTELTEHRLGGNDGNLPRSIRIWKYFLMYQFVLLGLCSDDLVQRAVLIEEEVRVSIAQNTCAFRSQHETLFASMRYVKRPHLKLAISQRLPCG